jgi:predicted metal-dependent RNase
MVARFQLEGKLPDVPVYASGLGRSVYEVYCRFEEHLKPGVSMSPLGQFGRVGDVWDPEVARALIKEPCIIVATSGMMIENTPSAMLAMYMVQEKQHGIFFVGYCDPDSLGYRLKHAKKGDRLRFALGAPGVEIALENIQSFHFSAHAPRGALQRIIDQVRPKNLIFVHGDAPAVEWMRDHSGDGCAKFVPNIGETVVLRA